jgi:hypothetical protein
MPKKPAPFDAVEVLQHLVKHMDERFDQVDRRFKLIDGRFDRLDEKFAEVLSRCDRIEFLVSGQERRISILEDRMRVVATKLGLEFRQQA